MSSVSIRAMYGNIGGGVYGAVAVMAKMAKMAIFVRARSPRTAS